MLQAVSRLHANSKPCGLLELHQICTLRSVCTKKKLEEGLGVHYTMYSTYPRVTERKCWCWLRPLQTLQCAQDFSASMAAGVSKLAKEMLFQLFRRLHLVCNFERLKDCKRHRYVPNMVTMTILIAITVFVRTAGGYCPI